MHDGILKCLPKPKPKPTKKIYRYKFIVVYRQRRTRVTAMLSHLLLMHTYARIHLRQSNAFCYGIAVINEQERNSRVEHFLYVDTHRLNGNHLCLLEVTIFSVNSLLKLSVFVHRSKSTKPQFFYLSHPIRWNVSRIYVH